MRRKFAMTRQRCAPDGSLTRVVTSFWLNPQIRRGAVKTITKHYINGAYAESHGREVMDIVNPTNGKAIARVTLADEENARRASTI
jgi:hypothetical protein